MFLSLEMGSTVLDGTKQYLSSVYIASTKFPNKSWLNDFPTKHLQEDKWQIITGKIDVNHFMKNPETENLFFFKSMILRAGKYSLFLIFKLHNLYLLKEVAQHILTYLCF